MTIFFRRASISAIAILLTSWPTEVVCQGNALDWLTQKKIEVYWVVGLGGLLLVTIIGCILCLWCSRRRRGKDFFTKDAREDPCDDNSWEMITSSTKESKKADSKEQDSDNVTVIKISVQNTTNEKDEEKFREATADLVVEPRDEQHKHQTQPDAVCTGNEIKNEENKSSMPSPTTTKAQKNVPNTPNKNSIDGTMDMKYNEMEGAKDGSQKKDSNQPHAEPLYAEVNKAKKKKVKSGYNIVYAELADFDKNRSDQNNQQRNNPSSAEYAEIARLTKSPRDMSPLDE
ncbi:uncharacterized protein LOC116287767 isoform X2 [Actinia tenebrosa]|uniref:Uncharacterized protein LOC116287767 isoform X2 n=1 Tax=Actinia tenebrosa TaxID=6105 RepID=A0A6P8HCA9_ACTTE|nr:uncharacterized protein LOC116287767 isoform X2 [Actinia tenebrosa]